MVGLSFSPLVYVACFAMRAAFSLMLCLVVIMCHVRAVRFVHALCSDVVVLVSALLSLVLFLPLFCLVFLFVILVLVGVWLLFPLVYSCSSLPFWGSDCWRSLARSCFSRL